MENVRATTGSGEYREQLTRLPQLADAVIHLNIQDRIQRLKGAAAWQQSAGRSSETLIKYADFRVVLVALKKGSHVKEHHADGPISVQCIAGRIRLRVPDGQVQDGRVQELAAGDLLALQRGIEHDVEAVEESAFLLTISWSRKA